jgi:uncharacterized protein
MRRVPWDLVAAFTFGVVVAAVTTPVGVSGAVFLLPIQISVLGVPSPAVTPTNLLFNVVSVPGALLRYGRRRRTSTVLARRLLAGTLPGVVVGAFVRVYVVPGGTVFKALVAVLLLPLGLWLALREPRAGDARRRLGARALAGLGFAAGLVGGVYGIGGGSLLAPVLVAIGYAVAEVAPAALLSTFVTSLVGALTYAVMALAGHTSAGPRWALGLTCGLGGLVGGFVGASLQPRLPSRALRRGLGVVAVALAVAYLMQLRPR